jgi:superoxide dismutase, Fe-Mn family
MSTNRRDFLRLGTLATIGLSFLGRKAFAAANRIERKLIQQTTGPFTLGALPYAYDALEPHIDRATMEIHHTKHHQAYVNNLNKALESLKEQPKTLEDIFRNINTYSAGVRNNAGGHWNHTFFWNIMRTSYAVAANAPSGKLAEAINASFGSFEKFKEQFVQAGKDRFGSGWVWLVINAEKKLVICSTPNQDNPLMSDAPVKGTPILALDVWEHAYYLKYQNKRPDYLAAWWNVVNWERAGELFQGK